MTFKEYMRWEGWIALAIGVGIVVFGLANHHQSVSDTLVSGAILTIGTGVFMKLRYKVPFREPSLWFTEPALERSKAGRDLISRWSLLAQILIDITIIAAAGIGLSYLTDFWLTYVDFGIWAIVTGLIRIGPASAVIDQREREHGTGYRVARRPAIGPLELTEA